MATRSDFAQKLLTDLRMRKERMSPPASHSTSSTKGMPRDSYGNPSHNYKGPRQTKSPELVGMRPTNSQKRTKHGARSLSTQESSKQLVQYGGDRNSNQIGDLSRALTFFFGNKGNFAKSNSTSNNPILSFLHRIGRRALDIGKMERRNSTSFNKSSSQIINVSNLHINEISKGVQKLNKIIGAYSNNVTFDGYSVEIGRDLLKGAMDLEEMLANLQEASEQVINPHRKSQIKLLNENGEEEEEENESVPQKNLVARPRFSFDKPPRNSQDAKEMIKSDRKQSLIAPKYTNDATTLPRKQPSITSDGTYHKRSASCGSDFRPQSGKLPNVIAKLMGLEEEPQSGNFGSTPSRSSSKQKEVMYLKTTENRNGKIVEKMVENAEYLAPTASGRKLMQNDNSFKYQSPKSILKDFERVGVRKSVSGPQCNDEFHQFNKSPNDLHLKMRRKDVENHKEDIMVEKGQAKRVVDRYHIEKRNTDRDEKTRIEKKRQHMREKQVVPSKRSLKQLHDENVYKVSTNSNHRTDLLGNGRSMNLTANTRNLMFLKSCRSGTPSEIVSKTKNSKECIPPIKKEKTVNTVSIKRVEDHVEVCKRESPRRKEKVITRRNGTQKKTEVTSQDQISFLQKGKQLKLASIIKAREENLSNINSEEVDVLIVGPEKSEAITKMLVEDFPPGKEANESQSPIVVEDLPTLDDESSQNMATNTDNEDQLASLNVETCQESQKIELHSIKGCNEANLDNLNPQQHEQNQNLVPGNDEISEKEADDLQSPIVFSDLPTLHESDMATEISMDPIDNDNEGQLASLNEDTCLESQKFEILAEKGCNEASLANFNLQQQQQHAQKENQLPINDELLIESEIHLKQTLLKSRSFLNTVHALFNLSVPVNFLNMTDNMSQDDAHKLMLDFSFEVARKKGKRLDLSLYPSMKVSTLSVKVTSFDDLVNQLYTDFGNLKVVYGGSNEEQDSAEYIQEMLERDVKNRDPDVNGMWDMGWNEILFVMIERDKLIQDLERYLVDVVIEDIAKELLHLDG